MARAECGHMPPDARLKHLASFSYTVSVDPKIPAVRYYRSGTEMERMAKVYLAEGNMEDAYVLYLRFSTLFLEKILEHPEYKAVPVAMKQQNKARLKEILVILEQVKKKLMVQFEADYSAHLRRVEEERKQALEREQRKKQEPLFPIAPVEPSAPPPSYSILGDISYPSDYSPQGPAPTGPVAPSEPQKPTIDRSLKPRVSYNGGLRTVVVPHDTMSRFLALASSNTARDIETCGILAGRLAQNQFHITYIIVPKQNGTPDSCTTSHEEELFDVQDQNNLITLGWIHTHPTQTAFLSSVDLHTHCSYQMMLPEALAIVCAPKYQTTGFFCLTPSYGLNFIASCRLDGFHPHPSDPALFMESGHHCLDTATSIQVVDLRT